MVATADGSALDAQATAPTKTRSSFHFLHPRVLIWEPLTFVLDGLWRAIRFAVGAVIVGGILVNVVISLLTTGSIGLADPRTWPLMRPFLTHPENGVGVVSEAALLIVCALLAHRIRQRQPFSPTLSVRYNLKPVADVSPSSQPQRLITFFNPYYVSRRVRGSAENADEVAVRVLREASDAARRAVPEVKLGICVVGQPGAGCTRLAWQAIKSEAALSKWVFIDWRMAASDYSELVDDLARRHAKVVVWFDNLAAYPDSADPSAAVGLASYLRSKKIPFVLVATCSGSEARRRVARERMALLWNKLVEIEPGDLTSTEARTLAAHLSATGGTVALDSAAERRPGTIVMAVNGMGKEQYDRLPHGAKVILKTLKLLRSAGIREYTMQRVTATAADAFGFAATDWPAAFSALLAAGYLRMGVPTSDGGGTVDLEAEVYLDLAVPDYTGSQEASDDWAKLNATFATRHDGLGLARLGRAYRLREHLQPAQDCYVEALKYMTRDGSPREWALAQYGLGLVLVRRIEDAPMSDKALMVQAEECLQSAFTVITRESDPTLWAEGHSALASVLRQEAPSTQRPARPAVVRHAVEAARQALRVLSREAMPDEWAETELNLGLALLIQATMDPNVDAARTTLDRAIECCRHALSVFTPERSPIWWARAQRCLAEACSERATRANRSYRERLLSEAIPAYQAALRVALPEQTESDRAQMYARQGTALCSLGALRDGSEHYRLFEEAVTVYDLALAEYGSDTMSLERAETQCRLGVVLSDLANCTEGPGAISLATRAIAAYEDALHVLGRRGSVRDRDDVRLNLGELYLLRAGGNTSESYAAREDIKQGQGYVETALGHISETSDPTRFRRIRKLQRDLQKKARDLDPASR